MRGFSSRTPWPAIKVGEIYTFSSSGVSQGHYYEYDDSDILAYKVLEVRLRLSTFLSDEEESYNTHTYIIYVEEIDKLSLDYVLSL